MILVVGATGLLGSEICRVIYENKMNFKALVRNSSDPVKVKFLKGIADVEMGDLIYPQSLDDICQDVSTIISTASSAFSKLERDSIKSVDIDGQINLIEAAKLAGVKHFIFSSFRNNPNIQYPLSQAKREVENFLKKKKMKHTIIQASWVMEIWLNKTLGFDYENNSVSIYGEGKNKISWISCKDVAKIVLSCINNSLLYDKTLEVGGPEALSPLEVVKIFEEVSGKSFSIQFVSEEILRSRMEGESDPLLKSFIGLMLQYAYGDEMDMSEIRKLETNRFTSIRNYAEKVLDKILIV